jgi:hypothetical protein
MFSSKKPIYESKTDQNQTKKLPKEPVSNNVIDSTNQPIEEIPSNEHVINAPQGSVASDVQQVEDLIDPNIDQQPMIDDVNFSSNARYFDIFH